MNFKKIKDSILPSPIKKGKDSTQVKLNNYVKALHNKSLPYTPKPGHSPSTFGTKCLRKIYYSYFKLEKDSEIDVKTARIFETGNAYEAMVMSWLKGIGEHIPYLNKSDGQIPLKKDGSGSRDPQFPIHVDSWRMRKGYIDNVGVSDGLLWLYEIKSCASFKFQGLQEPMPEHFVQVATYFKAFNDMLAAGEFAHIPQLSDFKEVSGVKVVYINKDDSQVRIFVLGKEELDLEAASIQELASEVNDYIDALDLPPKTPDKCNWCPYKDKCDVDFNIDR